MTSSAAAVHVAVGVIEKDEKILIAMRPDHVHMGGLWEFPGGKVERGENILQALKREIYEELGIKVIKSRPLIQIPHTYPDKTVFLDVYKISQFSGEAIGKEQQEIRWIAKSDLLEYDFPAANLPIINAVTLPQHYLITPDPDWDKLQSYLKQLESALQNNIRLLQLRAKNLSTLQLEKLYHQVVPIVNRYSANLFVNCNLQTAKRLHIKHVHLNSQALMATKTLLTDIEVSASCHNVAEIQHANKIGAKFIVLSCVHQTASHPEVQALGWENFRTLCLQSQVPVFALGGLKIIDTDNAILHGAQGVAGISAFWPARNAD